MLDSASATSARQRLMAVAAPETRSGEESVVSSLIRGGFVSTASSRSSIMSSWSSPGDRRLGVLLGGGGDSSGGDTPAAEADVGDNGWC